jgi:glucuronoarabinoxylan endo-1,4-beta-xylanase
LPEQSHVTLTIHNLLGQEVARLTDEQQAAGFHDVRWDGKTTNGVTVGSGMYIYRIQAGSFVETRKMVFLK